MCNLYSITTNQAAIIALFRVVNRYVGNLAPMPGVFPDCLAPVVCNTWRRTSPGQTKAFTDLLGTIKSRQEAHLSVKGVNEIHAVKFTPPNCPRSSSRMPTSNQSGDVVPRQVHFSNLSRLTFATKSPAQTVPLSVSA
jgi:hypothetical protein